MALLCRTLDRSVWVGVDACHMLAWVHSLKVTQKLMLISSIFVVPDLILLCLFLLNINASIQFAAYEQQGNAYQQPLQRLLETLPEHALALQRSGKVEGNYW